MFEIPPLRVMPGQQNGRLCGGDASPGCTQIAAERQIAPCAPTVASLPPPLLRTLHQMCERGADASPAARVLSPRILCVTRLHSSEAAAVWALHQPSSPFEAGILYRPWHLRRSGASTSLMRIRASETLALGPVASVEASPLLCTTLCPSLKEGVCDDTFLLIYTRAENHTHTHLNHTHI